MFSTCPAHLIFRGFVTSINCFFNFFNSYLLLIYLLNKLWCSLAMFSTCPAHLILRGFVTSINCFFFIFQIPIYC